MTRYSRKPNPSHPLTILREHLFALKKQYRQRPTAELVTFVEFFAKAHQAKNGEVLTYKTEMPRHEIIEWLLERGAEKFKAEWEQRYGWPFDDVNDPRTFHARINQTREKQSLGLARDELARMEKAVKPEDAPADYEAERGQAMADLKEAIELNRYTWDEEHNAPVLREGVILEMFLPAHEMAVKLGEPAPFNCLVISDDRHNVYSLEEFKELKPEVQAGIRAYMARRIKETVDAGFGGVIAGTGGKLVDRRLHPNAIACSSVPETATLRELMAAKQAEPQPVES